LKVDAETQFHEFCAHIVEWGERIPTFVGSKSYAEFAGDELTYLAVWKCVEVLGEAASRILKIDPALAERHPDLQLKRAYGMRNRLTHGYSDVDLAILWSTIHDFVPPMVAAAKAILSRNAARK
jgi:uncharacterized protein with HEPN domain